MALTRHIQLLLWLIVAGLSPLCSAISLSTQTHCILVTSGDKKRQPLCPGEAMNVDPDVQIVAGFDDNSKADKAQMPQWQQSFTIAPKSIIDMRGPGFAAPMQVAYWGTDNCLYGNPQPYPIIAPATWYKPNKEYTKIGCASRKYAGPPVDNPWSTRDFGTTPESTANSDDFLDQLRFYRDYQPLYRVLHDGKQSSDDDQKKSNSNKSPFDTASAGSSSLFNNDFSPDYSAFLPSSDDGTYSDASWDVSSNTGSNLLATLGPGTDTFTDPGNLDSYDNFDLGSNLFSGSDYSTNFDYFNDDGFDDGSLFTKERKRRSARDFSQGDS